MPRFHLHVYNRIGFAPDEEGQELLGLDDAVDKAVEGARSILSEEVLQGTLDLRGRIEIAEPGGTVLRVIAFADTVRVLCEGEAR